MIKCDRFYFHSNNRKINKAFWIIPLGKEGKIKYEDLEDWKWQSRILFGELGVGVGVGRGEGRWEGYSCVCVGGEKVGGAWL